MSEAVTVPSLTMVTSTVFQESLASNTHIHRHTHKTVSVLYVKKPEPKTRSLKSKQTRPP